LEWGQLDGVPGAARPRLGNSLRRRLLHSFADRARLQPSGARKRAAITAALDLTQLQPLAIAIAVLLVALMLTTALLTALARILRLLTLLLAAALLLTGLLLAALMLLSALIRIIRHGFPFAKVALCH
jgi:hypothetical protein